MIAYREFDKIVVKVSGESLGSLDPALFRDVVKPLAEVHSLGVKLGVVVGGGNLLRGNQAHLWGVPRDTLDIAGMLATGVNASLLVGVLQSFDIPAQLFSRGPCSSSGTPYEPTEVAASFEAGNACVIAGGLGVPGISTDVAAVSLASDVGAEALFMSKFGVDGVYDRDPRLHPNAHFLPELSASYALGENLAIMDREALKLARAHGICIRVVPASDTRAIPNAICTPGGVGSVVWPR
ncbi:hypothetical protein [uncultured Nocardioides sp.]|uniref:amino acid kinase family protein n=1 Tax=uncultured Nocardioides sp. TaxID=198441 RepID=UPI002607B2B1|nr:hypothetical protein [uncultured Nocardioides sp.]